MDVEHSSYIYIVVRCSLKAKLNISQCTLPPYIHPFQSPKSSTSSERLVVVMHVSVLANAREDVHPAFRRAPKYAAVCLNARQGAAGGELVPGVALQSEYPACIVCFFATGPADKVAPQGVRWRSLERFGGSTKVEHTLQCKNKPTPAITR